MIFKNNHSLLITKGLGGPACCAMITVRWSLRMGCKVEVIDPPYTGGGGVAAVPTPFYVPRTQVKRADDCNKQVRVTFMVGKDDKWKKTFTVNTCNGDKAVKVVNLANKTVAQVHTQFMKAKVTISSIKSKIGRSDE